MRRMRGVGTVIGVDLNPVKARRIELTEMPSGWSLLLDRLRPRKRRRYRLPSLPVLLINSTVLYSLSRQREGRALTDLYFNPPLERVGMLDWKRFDQVVKHGYEHALQVLGSQAPTPASEATHPSRTAAQLPGAAALEG
jgi:NTE family protein